MVAIPVTGTPTLLADVQAPSQVFIQNQSAFVAAILPQNGSGGTQLSTGDTLIMGFQDPLVPHIKIYGTGNGTLDVEIWPY